jgi:hypothetical protein
MPPKFANLKPREVIRALRFDLPKHIIKSIVRQAGLTNAEFFELLDQ